MSDGLAARREAALRLPPLADGRRDPDFEPVPACYICGTRKAKRFDVFGQSMCRDRVLCYQRVKKQMAG